MYGNLIIAEEKPFSLLEAVKKELIMKGYDRALFHKHYKPQKIMTITQVQVPANTIITTTLHIDAALVKAHIPSSPQDVAWFYKYIDLIGEETLFKMKDYIYSLCYKLSVGEFLDISSWIIHIDKKCKQFENWSIDNTTDLFIKILWCFFTESNGCYSFSSDYKRFLNYMPDARKME